MRLREVADIIANPRSHPPINYSLLVPQSSALPNKSISHRESNDNSHVLELTDVETNQSSLHRCPNRLWLCEIVPARTAARYMLTILVSLFSSDSMSMLICSPLSFDDLLCRFRFFTTPHPSSTPMSLSQYRILILITRTLIVDKSLCIIYE